MLKEFKHYGVTVFYQVVEGQTFKQALRKAGIDYVDLPIMLPVGAEAIRYEKDGAARYACTKDGDDCQMVYITDRIPDDLDFVRLMSDIDGQRGGDEPEWMETKLQKLIREATQRLAEEKGNPNPFMMPDDPEPEDVMMAITAMFGYGKNDLEEMDRSGIDKEYFSELIK